MQRAKAKFDAKPGRRAPLMMALEPRIMFDGAAAATAHALQTDHHDVDGRHDAPTATATVTANATATSAHAMEMATAPPTAPTVVFVDSRVQDSASLLQGITPGTEVVYLKPTLGGLQQIAGYLEHHHEVGSVEIIAHGGDGDLLLGSTDVDSADLNSFTSSLTAIHNNLRSGADILLYACNTAEGARGAAFVEAFARDTGHAVAASSNVTGNGGDWTLEVTTGPITAVPVLSAAAEMHYGYTLGTTAVGTAAQLNAAILADDLDLLGNDTITLTSNITYASAADAVNIVHPGVGTLTIDGGGYAIDAASLSRVLTVTAGNVILENVTLQHGLLAGAGAVLSAPGMSELGAGIFNAGTLTLNNVTVTQNVATGGGGGASYVAGNGGAGGNAAGGIYNAGTGKLFVIGSSAITNNVGAAGGGGGGTGSLLGVPFHGGVGGQGVGGLWNAPTGQVYLSASAYAAMTGDVGSSGTTGAAINGASNLGFAAVAADAKINSTSGTVVTNYVPVAPVVASVDVVGSTPNNATSEQFSVTFSEPVTGVNVTDFSLHDSGTASGVITSVTGSGSTYTVLVSPALGEGTLRLDVNGGSTGIVDASGNALSGGYTSGQSYTLDHTPPFATSIDTVSVSPNSATTERFTVDFSENVSGVTASDFSLLDTGTVGGTIASVAAVSGSVYTVTVAGVTGNGTMQLNLNGSGTGIVDTAGNAIVGGSPLIDQVYTITHALPTVVAITTVGANPSNASSDQFTVTFSENVTGVNAADFSLHDTGTVGGVITSVTGSGSTYTVLVSPVVGDGTLRLDLNPINTVIDASGNVTAGGYMVGQSYTIDHTPPVATSIVTVGANPNAANSEQFTVAFSENVTGVTAADFALLNTGTVAGTIAAVSGSGSTYTVAVTGVTGDGTMQLNLDATGTGIVDTAGNAILGGALGQVYGIEHTPPVATSIVTVGANPNHASSDQFTVTFSENVTGVTSNDFGLVKTGSVAGTVASVTPVSGNVYTVTVNNVSGDGTLQLNLNAVGTGIVDASGNAIVGGALGQVYGIEHTQPAVTSIVTVGANPNNAGSDQFTVNFSTAVTGVNAADFSLHDTGTVGGAITSVTGSGSTYTVLVSPVVGDGTLRLDLDASNTVIDAAGNGTAGGYTNGQVYTIEHTPPVATSISASSGDSSSGTSEQFTVNFSENVSGVAAGDFSLASTGTVGGTIASVSGTGSSYTVTVNGVTGNGTMQLNLNASGTGIADASGNTLVGGAVGPLYAIAHAVPAVTSIDTVGANPTNASSDQFTVQFSEGVTGVTAADFSLHDTGTVGGVVTSVTGSGSTYTVLVSPVVGDGTMRLDLNPINTVVDASGNVTAGGFTGGQVYTIEHTPPVATRIATVGANPNHANSEQFTVSFSESVSGVTAGDFTLVNTGTVAGSIAAVSGSGSAYTVTVNGVSGDGTMQLALNATGTGIVDAAGNGIVGGSVLSQIFALEHTGPTVTSIATVGSNPSDRTSEQFDVMFSEGVTGVNAADFSLATTGTAAGTFTSVTGSGSSYVVTVGSVVGDGTMRLDLNSVNTVIDAAGNTAAPYSGGPVYTIDHTPPVATSITAAGSDTASGTSDQFTVDFSENVTGVAANDFTLATTGGAVGTITSVTPSSGGAYTVTVDGVHGTGTLQLNLNVSGTGIVDLAGNAIVGGYVTAPPFSVSSTAPSVTSIVTLGNNPNNASSDSFAVNFSENVTGVSISDFALSDTGNVAGTIAAVSGSGSAYTVTVNNVTGDGTMRLDLNASGTGITDGSGHAIAGGFTGGQTFSIEHTPPVATSISTIGANPSNANSEQFAVDYSENVTGVSAGDFTLTDGGNALGTVAAVAGSGNAYVVTVTGVTGDGSMRLDLNALGTGIADAAGNALGAGYTAGQSYVIDHTAPVVSSISTAGMSPNNALSDTFTVDFSENVTGVSASDFVLTNGGTVTGTIGSVTPVAGSSSRYTVAVNGVLGDGTLRLDLVASAPGITDTAGNAISASFMAGQSYTIEHTPPIATSIATVGNNPTNANTEQFTVNFSQGVSGVGAGDFTLIATGAVTGAITAVTPVSGSTYIVTVGGVTGDGTLQLDLNATGTGITDAAGNALLGGYISGQPYVIRQSPPTVASIDTVGNSPNHANSEQFAVTFSENVTGVTATDFSLADGGSVAGTIAAVSGAGSLYTVTVTGVTGDGTMRLDLNGSGTAIHDATGNAMSGGYSAGESYSIEHTAPVVSAISTAGMSPNNASSDTFTVDFSENVTGVSASDFVLTTGGTVTGTIASVTAVSGSVYTVAVMGVAGDGTMRLDLDGSGAGIADAAGNAIGAGYIAGQTYTIEHTPPVVSSVEVTGPSPNDATTEIFAVNFSENVTGVTAGDFVLTTGGTVTGTIGSVTPVSVSGNAYLVAVTGVSGDGSMRLDVNSANTGITDAAGNSVSGGFTAGEAYTVQHTAPTVASIDTVGNSPNHANSEQFAVTFSENVAGVTAADFSLTDGGSVAGTIAAVSGAGSLYTVTVTGVTGDGTMRLDLNGSGTAIHDAAGNAVSGGYSAGESYGIEHTAPEIVSIARTGTNPSNASAENFTVTFSEDVTGVSTGDFVLTNSGTATGTIAAVTAVSGSVYSVAVTGVTGDGRMRLDLNGSGAGIVDAAGNSIGAGYLVGQTYTLEHSAPVVSSISVVGISTTDATSEQFTVHFSENVSGVNSTDFTLTNTGTVAGTIASVSGTGSTYTVTVNGVSGEGGMRLDLNSSGTGIVDAAGNAIAAGFTAGQTYEIGQTLPEVTSITLVGPPTNNAASEQFTVNFSENVVGVAVNDFVLSTTGTVAGTIASVSGSGSSYIVTVTGVTGDGTLRLDLNGLGAGIDDASNHSIATGFTAGQVYTVDHTAPTVAIAVVGPATNNAVTEQFTVTFSESVTGVTVGDFALTRTGTAAGIVSAVSGTGSTYTVTLSGVSGDGTLGLALNPNSAITDTAGNRFASGAVGGSGAGATTIEHTSPAVASVTPAGNSANAAPPSVASTNVATSGGGAANATVTAPAAASATAPTAPAMPVYMGYVDNLLYEEHEALAARAAPLYPVSSMQLPEAAASEFVAGIVTDHSVMPPNGMNNVVAPSAGSFAFTLPVGSFQFDPGAVVVVHATLSNGDALPRWLSFDSVTGKFEGTAPAGWNDHLHIVVTARDQSGREVMTPVEVQFAASSASDRTPTATPPRGEPRVNSMHAHRARHQHTLSAGKASLTDQFARYGRGARERELHALMGHA